MFQIFEEVNLAGQIINLHFALLDFQAHPEALLLGLVQLLALLVQVLLFLQQLVLQPLRFPQKLVELSIDLLQDSLVLDDYVILFGRDNSRWLASHSWLRWRYHWLVAVISPAQVLPEIQVLKALREHVLMRAGIHSH